MTLAELANVCAAEITSDATFRTLVAAHVLPYFEQVEKVTAGRFATPDPAGRVPEAHSRELRRSPTPTQPRPRSDWEIRLIQCARILQMVSQLPDRAADFGDSVSEKVYDMQAWIEDNNHVTAAQQDALDNMESGVERWLQ